MKSRDRAARDGNKTTWEYLSGENRSGSIHKSRQRRQLQVGMQHDHPYRQQNHDAQLDEGAQVIPRRQQQPYRQHARQESVGDQHLGQRHARKRKQRSQPSRFRHRPPAEYRRQHQHEPDEGDFQHFPRPEITHIQAHEHADGHRRRNGERPPRAILQRIHHHQSHHREQNDHDHQHREQRHEAAYFTDLLARHLPQCFPVSPQAAEQHHEILHGTAQNRADHDPQRSRQVTELRRQRRPHQRPRTGNRREMMPEDDPFIGGLEIVSVAQPLSRRGPAIVQSHHLRR